MSTTPHRMFEDLLGCKWTLGILAALHRGIVRPGRLQRSMPGLSTKVMQERLRKLERWGVVRRVEVAAKPLHVEYRLTAKGRQMGRVLASIDRFAERWAAEGPERP